MADSAENERVPWREVLRPELAARLLLVSLGVWLHAADGLIVATMMPRIVSEIGGDAFVAWTVALYELGSILAAASAALLTLRFGVRVPMSLAALLFGAGCLVSALAPSMPVLLIGRMMQGLGGGALVSMSFIAAVRLFPIRLTARVMAVISLLWGASAFLGPLIGGLFVEYATWRWGFGFFAAQALALALWIFLTARYRENAPKGGASAPAPLLRLGLLGAAVLCVAYAGIRPEAMRTGGFILLGLLFLAAYTRLDAGMGAARLMPPRPFDIREPVGAALVMTLAMNAATMGLGTYGALLLVSIHGTPLLMAGYILACVAIGWTASALIASGAPEKNDPRNIALGISLVFISIAGLCWAMPYGSPALVAFFALMEGAGFGLEMTFTIRRARRMVAAEEIERLSGAMSTTGRFGYALGASITGILANAAGFSVTNTAEESIRVAQIVFGTNLVLALVGVLAMVSFVRPRPVVSESAAAVRPPAE